MPGAAAAWDDAVALGEEHGYRERPGDRAGADRHHRLHDGLRHHRRRAGHRARQVQAARRRRPDEDRQPHRARGSGPPRLQRRAGERDRQLHRRARHHRGGAARGRTSTCRCSTCAFKPANGQRSIHYSGAPEDDRRDAAVHLRGDLEDDQRARPTRPSRTSSRRTSDAWRLGTKAVSIYRDGSKRTQPLNTTRGDAAQEASAAPDRPVRRRLPDERQANHPQVRHRGGTKATSPSVCSTTGRRARSSW